MGIWLGNSEILEPSFDNPFERFHFTSFEVPIPQELTDPLAFLEEGKSFSLVSTGRDRERSFVHDQFRWKSDHPGLVLTFHNLKTLGLLGSLQDPVQHTRLFGNALGYAWKDIVASGGSLQVILSTEQTLLLDESINGASYLYQLMPQDLITQQEGGEGYREYHLSFLAEPEDPDQEVYFEVRELKG